MSGRAPVAVVLLGLATLLTVAGGLLLADPVLLSAWRLAITMIGGLAIGGLALLAIGQLLSNAWTDAIRDELLPMAATLPIVVLLAVPLALLAPEPAHVLFGGDLTGARAAWFTPEARQLRLGLCVAALTGAVALLARRHRRDSVASAIGLAVTALAAVVLAVDWIMVVKPIWWSRLLPFCVTVGQLGAALALAFLLNLAQRETVTDPRNRSLSSALLAVALLGLWVWYAQYLVAWSGNLPAEAAWYLARMEAAGPLLVAAAAAQVGAVPALLFFRRNRAVTLAASLLMVAAYLLHSAWLLRPSGTAPLALIDVLVLAWLGTLWLGWLVLALRLYDRLHGAGSPSQGSVHEARGGGRRAGAASA
jgi:hypothetical protein